MELFRLSLYDANENLLIFGQFSAISRANHCLHLWHGDNLCDVFFDAIKVARVGFEKLDRQSAGEIVVAVADLPLDPDEQFIPSLFAPAEAVQA